MQHERKTRKGEKTKRQNTTLNKQLEAVGVVQGRDENKTIIELGKFFIDLAKLVFGGVILTVLLNYREYKMPLLVSGMMFIVFFVILGLMLIDRGRKK